MLIVDRFEENKAVIFDEDKQLIISREEVSAAVREGDVIYKDDSGIYITNKESTERKRDENLALLRRILNKKKNG